MRVALTGATGFIGSHVLTELHEHGHEVVALVRDDEQADRRGTGATPARVDLTDRPAVVSLLGGADAASTRPARATRPAQTWTPRWPTRRSRHSRQRQALPADQRSVDLREQHVDRRRVAVMPPRWWRQGADRTPRARRRRHARGRDHLRCRLRRRRGGVPGVLLGSPRDDDGNLIMLGSGQQHWDTVHAADLAKVLGAYWKMSRLGAATPSPTAEPDRGRDHRGGRRGSRRPGAVPGSDEEARARLGDYFAEVLLLDQNSPATKVRNELDWRPSHPGLVEEFRSGSYRQVTAG